MVNHAGAGQVRRRSSSTITTRNGVLRLPSTLGTTGLRKRQRRTSPQKSTKMKCVNPELSKAPRKRHLAEQCSSLGTNDCQCLRDCGAPDRKSCRTSNSATSKSCTFGSGTTYGTGPCRSDRRDRDIRNIRCEGFEREGRPTPLRRRQ